MTEAGESATVAAGIVSYHPDPTLLLPLVDALAGAVGRIYLFNNAPLDPALDAALAACPELVAIDAETNLGIGVALNVIALAASRDGFERLVTFDQDSRAWPGLVARLGTVFDALAARGRKPAAVGPRLVAPSGGEPSKAPRYRPRRGVAPEPEALPVDFLPTSGTLFNLRTLRETGLFRADFFIDGIDLEWCFRAWRRGRSCWLAGDVRMEHTVGSGTIQLGFGLSMPDQRPFRMGTYVRNAVYCLRLRHIPLGWKLRQAAYLPLQMTGYARHHGFRRASMRTDARRVARRSARATGRALHRTLTRGAPASAQGSVGGNPTRVRLPSTRAISGTRSSPKSSYPRRMSSR